MCVIPNKHEYQKEVSGSHTETAGGRGCVPPRNH